ASAIGKSQLINLNKNELKLWFLNSKWEKKTIHTISSIDDLYKSVNKARKKGYAIENEESALGFHCVAAPIYNLEEKIIAAVSFSMPTSSWEEKFDKAKDEILRLSSRLSNLAGSFKSFENS